MIRLPNYIKRILGSLARSLLRPLQNALSRFPHLRAYFFDTIQAPLAISTGAEFFVVSTKDGVIGRELYARHEFDLEKFEIAKALLGRDLSDFTIVDVGANVGSICLPLVKRNHVRRAIAIEPEPLNFRLLSANIWLNDLAGKVTSYNVAVGATSGSIQFELSDSNFGDHRVSVSNAVGVFNEQSRSKISVSLQTLDSLISHELDDKLFLWIDTQGYEGFVLQGASRLLEKKVPFVVEFWPYAMDRASSYEPFLEAILNAGYTSFYDLNDKYKVRQAADKKSIQKIYQNLKKTNDWTDILFV